MKKITLLLTIFILVLGTQSYAQEVAPRSQDVDRIEYDDEQRDNQSAKQGKRKRGHKHAKQRKRAHKHQLKSMRRVAKADGIISPKEKEVIRSEKRKMKRKGKMRRNGKRKGIERRNNIEKNAGPEGGRK